MSNLNRRISLPLNISKFMDTDLESATASASYLNISSPLEHLELLLQDMNDFCECGAEILKALKETRKEFDWFKHVYNKNKELKNKIVELKELNEVLFDEVFKYINETGVFIESNVITSETILEH